MIIYAAYKTTLSKDAFKITPSKPKWIPSYLRKKDGSIKNIDNHRVTFCSSHHEDVIW